MNTGEASDEVVIFDFLSHAAMHHAFNEGYVRVLRAAFPGCAISFNAGEGQIRQLTDRVADLRGVALKACPTFEVSFGCSRHNPLMGRWAAYRCLQTMRSRISRNTKLVAVLGVDANLFAVLSRAWPRVSSAALHMILHSHLGEAMVWRSRNPMIRTTDFVAVLRRPLPPKVRLIVLELGIKSAIVELAPHLESSIGTLEHPTLPSEWISEPESPKSDKLSIAFLGHARRAKGFPEFVEMARCCAGPDLDFQAIGLASPDTADLDTSFLTRSPSPVPLSRPEYLAALRGVDMVCLPLNIRAYDFTASGTVSDAVAALKPLIALRNRSLGEIVAKYGRIGHLAYSQDQLAQLIKRASNGSFVANRSLWLKNLRRIRDARRPNALAVTYSELIGS